MANPQLTKEQREALFQPLFECVEEELERLSGGDERLLWALRRKLAKELVYLERSTPAARSKLKIQKRMEQKGICPVCNERLPEKNAELDRFEAFHGYTAENTRLVHHAAVLALSLPKPRCPPLLFTQHRTSSATLRFQVSHRLKRLPHPLSTGFSPHVTSPPPPQKFNFFTKPNRQQTFV